MPESAEGHQDGHRPVDIWVLGLGMRASHLLPETADALRRCRRVLYLSHVPGVREMLSEHCADLVDLSGFYQDGTDRLGTYKRIAAATIDAALDRTPVALAVYGHPLVLSVPSTILIRLGAEFGLSVKALPAVSALDCLQADLGVDLVAAGLQTHEATDVLLYRRRLLPEIAAVLWQIGVLETRLSAGAARSRPQRLLRLREHLLRFYPAGHEAIAVSSSVDVSAGPELHRFRLEALADMVDDFHLGTTLYIPAVPDRSPPDPSVMADLMSSTHLEQIVRSAQDGR
jgi:precorrin-2 methylase